MNDKNTLLYENGNSNFQSQQKVFSIDLSNSSFDEEYIKLNMKERKQEYKSCYELNIKYCKISNFTFPFEILGLNRLNIIKTNLITLENLNYTPNITSINLSFNKLVKIPEIYHLSKLEMLILNDNFIESIDFNKFKDFGYLKMINLQNNKILFKEIIDFTSNMNCVKDKLKQLKSFNFTGNPYYRNAPKEKIDEFLLFYQKNFLSNLNFENEKEKLEKEFISCIEEINYFQQRNKESLLTKLSEIKKQIENFTLNPNIIDIQYEKFKENTNKFLLIMNTSSNQILSLQSEINIDAKLLEELISEIIRELNILTDKIDNRAFIDQSIHFLVGILRVKQGNLADSIIGLLTHIAENKKMEDILVKNLMRELTGKDRLDYFINIPKGEDEKIILLEEINGYSNQTKREKGMTDEEEISLATILKSYPKILDSFKMFVNEKYDKLFVYLFRSILKNLKYESFISNLPSAWDSLFLTEKDTKGQNIDINLQSEYNYYIKYSMEYFNKCFTSIPKSKILQNLNKFEIMKLISFSIGIIKKFEFHLKENPNIVNNPIKNEKRFKNGFLEIVVIFSKIFKSIIKYFFFPYLNKKVFSDSNQEERTKFINSDKGKSTLSDKDFDIDLGENDFIDGKIEDYSEYEKQKYISEYIKNNFRIIIEEVVNKDINKLKKNVLLFENINKDNFDDQLENFLFSDLLEIYKYNIDFYRKFDTYSYNFNNYFLLFNQIVSYMIKINILVKSGFLEPESNSYLNIITSFYTKLFKYFIKKTEIQTNNIKDRDVKKNDKSVSNLNDYGSDVSLNNGS